MIKYKHINEIEVDESKINRHSVSVILDALQKATLSGRDVSFWIDVTLLDPVDWVVANKKYGNCFLRVEEKENEIG